MSRFVIVIDAQGDFMHADGALPVPGAEALIAPMRDCLAALRPDNTAGVLFTFDTHLAETYAASPEAEEFPIHCVRGTPGWAGVVDPTAIFPALPLFRLEKGVFDMWAEPDVVIEDLRRPHAPPMPRDSFFAGLKADGVEEITLIGVAADYCVRWAAVGLIECGFRVTIPPALTRGIVRQIEDVTANGFVA